MIGVLKTAGADNIDCYPAALTEIESQKRYDNYKAVNIIGLVAAADLGGSSYVSHSATALIDTDFDALSIDPARARGLLLFRLAESVNGIVIHDRIREALESGGIKYLNFVDPQNWSG